MGSRNDDASHPDLKFLGTLIHTKPKWGFIDEVVVAPRFHLFSRVSILGDNLSPSFSSEGDGGFDALKREMCAHMMYVMQMNMRISISENQLCQDKHAREEISLTQ